MVPNTIAAERRRESSEIWPNITRQKPAPPDADAFVNVPDKYAKYFSPNPGERD
jgi:ferredoxin